MKDEKKVRAVLMIIQDQHYGWNVEDHTAALCGFIEKELNAIMEAIEVIPDDPFIISSRLQRRVEERKIQFLVIVGGSGIIPQQKGLEDIIKHLGKTHQVSGIPARTVNTRNGSGPMLSKKYTAIMSGRTFILFLPSPQTAALDRLETIMPDLKRLFDGLWKNCS